MEVFLPLLPTSTGLPERSDQHSTRPLACPEGHWVWPPADSQANLTEPEKPRTYSGVFPNKPCARSDKLCEVTRNAARKGPLLYPPWLAIAYGFRRMNYLLPARSNRLLANYVQRLASFPGWYIGAWERDYTEMESCPYPRVMYIHNERIVAWSSGMVRLH